MLLSIFLDGYGFCFLLYCINICQGELWINLFKKNKESKKKTVLQSKGYSIVPPSKVEWPWDRINAITHHMTTDQSWVLEMNIPDGTRNISRNDRCKSHHTQFNAMPYIFSADILYCKAEEINFLGPRNPTKSVALSVLLVTSSPYFPRTGVC